MRKLVLNLHLFTALVAGAFMVIQGITGSILEFEPELDRLLHPHLAYVTPAERPLSLQEIGANVSRQLGAEPVVAYVNSLSPRLSSQVLLPSGVAYVNQYTGEVLGVRTRGQTFLGVVRALHTRLGLRQVGREIARWSAVAALFSAVSGLYLWWPLKRITIHRESGPRRFWFDLHNVIGICSLVPLALLALTGVVLGFEQQAATVIYTFTRSGPTQISQARPKVVVGTASIDPDRAVAIARSQMPGAVVYRVQMPAYGGLYRIELVNQQDRVAGERNSVAVDPSDGSVVSFSRSEDLSVGDRFLAANEAVHTGNILGWPSRILAALVSTMLVVQAFSGLFIWLHRNKILYVSGRSAAKERFA
ncbi:MAG TPA: PepSY-associated TM helix domain-containing protein [Candidatus Sulfotelmatobacter sp.]|nr:PepSY-associated TM helix domain-containing protein [Candidatus Sulfotelmatobacter sp.]